MLDTLMSYYMETVLKFMIIGIVCLIATPIIAKCNPDGKIAQHKKEGIIVLLVLLAFYGYKSIPFVQDIFHREIIRTECTVLESYWDSGSKYSSGHTVFSIDTPDGIQKIIATTDVPYEDGILEGNKYEMSYYKYTGILVEYAPAVEDIQTK